MSRFNVTHVSLKTTSIYVLVHYHTIIHINRCVTFFLNVRGYIVYTSFWRRYTCSTASALYRQLYRQPAVILGRSGMTRHKICIHAWMVGVWLADDRRIECLSSRCFSFPFFLKKKNNSKHNVATPTKTPSPSMSVLLWFSKIT